MDMCIFTISLISHNNLFYLRTFITAEARVLQNI